MADLMGQFASGTAPALRERAAPLLRLYPAIDRAYLDASIRDETAGDHGIDDIEG